MVLTQVVLRFAGSPDDPYGDDGRGYIVVAPLTDDGLIDPVQVAQQPATCTVVHFLRGVLQPSTASLERDGAGWRGRLLDQDASNPVTMLCRWRDQALSIGQYLEISGADGVFASYRVSEHFSLGDAPLAIAAARLASADW